LFHGAPAGSTRRPDPERLERAQAITREYASGATLAQLGSAHRIATGTVRNLVLAVGGQMRARGTRTPRRGRGRAQQDAGRCDEQERPWR